MPKKVLFLDRDGTLVIEPPIDYQLDSLEKLVYYPRVFQYLSKIAQELEYELVMITNQDGLGTSAFPEETFWPAHHKIIQAFEQEGVAFDEVYIDRSFPEENAPTRKPRTGLLTKYIEGDYDLANSYVIGDRLTDMELAKNLGAQGIWINSDPKQEACAMQTKELMSTIALATKDWAAIYQLLKLPPRITEIERNTKETKIKIRLNLDGTAKANINTGIPFFDHMLDQLARHSGIDLEVLTQGDLEVDEHHTIEDTAIALGAAFRQALGNKKGIERYGFCLPMDDCLAQVALDFGGRNWMVWEAEFKREMIGKMPTEMFFHFFKSFSDAALCNLNIQAKGKNEHHKIEAIFKAWAKSIKQAIKRDPKHQLLPSTKGLL
ncbi:bifunctional histidinol-phosphatase/imidazoleglycerol-phosphate dehydratase HisB [Aureispira anguillae]|uniref:Histidine biosynthesis bifunctional protein HisB n=1 Tax=Aureispira anguillae TaxID=2864201 RepID=A0A915YF37_9BACT|nr:bifunctional histidinol-phosphatase/imidazoleglycerol-phosphate dehydratase HisB [Aureispira anguillae]BDS11838.1 bifunctional histidinol-phosphatase/imidazoleglycerol-phosphate dehydratase HisB [Aureispira anguillae]